MPYGPGLSATSWIPYLSTRFFLAAGGGVNEVVVNGPEIDRHLACTYLSLGDRGVRFARTEGCQVDFFSEDSGPGCDSDETGRPRHKQECELSAGNKKMRNQTKIVLLLTAGMLLPATTLAQVQNSPAQGQIANECTTKHFAASGNAPLLQQIEDTCSADNAGSQFTTSDMLAGLIGSRLVRRDVDVVIYRDSSGGYNVSPPDSGSLSQTGLNAGDTFGNINVWGNFSWTSLDNDFVNTAFNSTLKNVAIGADTSPMDNMVVGVTLGYENTDVDTLFNAGRQDIDGFTVAGYLGYLINDNVSFDVTVGLSRTDIKQNRLLSAFGTAAGPFLGVAVGTNIVSSLDADRSFAAANLNGFWQIDNWIVGAHGGYLRANEDHDAFSETGGGVTSPVAARDFDLGQWRLGFDVAYSASSSLEPYFGIDYIKESTRENVTVAPGLAQPANDDDDFLISLGLRYFSDQGVSGDLRWEVSASREDIDASTFSAIVRVDF